MPMQEVNGASIHYEVSGDGFPVLLIAPGGMRSAISYWENTPWNPIEDLSPEFTVVAMDQRNAGQSSAPVAADDGWDTYAKDQLELMSQLGYERFHVAGMCIGGPYAMGLIAKAPERVASAVLFQPIGYDDNRDAFYAMFDSWADELKTSSHADVDAAAWTQFRSNLYDGDFLFNLDRNFVASCETPLLVLLGTDLYHPESTSREVASLAKNATLIEHWKETEHVPAAREAVRSFLQQHTG